MSYTEEQVKWLKLRTDRDFWKLRFEMLAEDVDILWNWIESQGQNPEELLKDIEAKRSEEAWARYNERINKE